MPNTIYTGPDPTTTTRADMTTHHLDTPCPQSASPRYKHIFHTHQTLLKLLIELPAMDVNRDQTYMTPAASKNKVYFMWDFIGRTWGMLCNVPPANPSGKHWQDVILRCVLAQELILDDTEKLEQMNRATGYNDDAGVEVTEEIKEQARRLDEKFTESEKAHIQRLRSMIPSGRIMDGLGGR